MRVNQVKVMIIYNVVSCMHSLTLGACARGTVVVLCVCVCVCVCVSVCLSVTALAATYLVCMSKLRHHRVPCRLLKVFIAWISLKIFCSGDTA